MTILLGLKTATHAILASDCLVKFPHSTHPSYTRKKISYMPVDLRNAPLHAGIISGWSGVETMCFFDSGLPGDFWVQSAARYRPNWADQLLQYGNDSREILTLKNLESTAKTFQEQWDYRDIIEAVSCVRSSQENNHEILFLGYSCTKQPTMGYIAQGKCLPVTRDVVLGSGKKIASISDSWSTLEEAIDTTIGVLNQVLRSEDYLGYHIIVLPNDSLEYRSVVNLSDNTITIADRGYLIGNKDTSEHKDTAQFSLRND